MAFRIEYNGDITKYKGDVIINSVGVTSTIYGGICGSIVKASSSGELKKIIDGVDDLYSVGEYFITDGYALPVKNILHLITPNFDNDPDYVQFKECIRRILNECNLRDLKKIGIPSIGTGANKYDKSVSRKIIEEMCTAYCSIYPEMDITLVLPDQEISSENDERIQNESYNAREYHDPKTKKKFEKGSKAFGDTININKNNAPYDQEYFAFDNFKNGEGEISFVSEGIKTIGDYVEKYIDVKVGKDFLSPDEKKLKKKINLYLAAGKKGNKDYVHAGSDAFGEIRYKSTADKKQFFKIILALRMTKLEATMFLNHFGYCFACDGINELDDAIKGLIKDRQYGIVEASLKIPYLFKK